jgi:hypothetical protein
MSNAHAAEHYFGSGTESDYNSAPIATYDASATAPDAIVESAISVAAPQPGLNAPSALDKRRGSS